jgi:hypothetical protein
LHKPLKVTFWSRVKLLVRGLLFYNTVYWKRASDGLNPPKLTSEERKSYVPPKNPEVIRPRDKPRARLVEARRRQTQDDLARWRLRLPPALGGRIPPAAAAPQARLGAGIPAGGSGPLRSPTTLVNPIKRRRRRHRQRPPGDDSPVRGFFARLLEKWTR